MIAKDELSPAQILTAALNQQAEHGHGIDLFCSPEHGFVPIKPPLTALPSSHQAWDQIIADLPSLTRDRRMLKAGSELPILRAGPEDLEPTYLCRAATILGHLVHAWVRAHPEQYPDLPPGLSEPWKVVSERLDRPKPFLSANDFVAYNWTLNDPAGPRVLENMDVLIKTVGNDAERVSMLTVTEILAQSGPLIAAVITCTEGVLQHDREAVARGLDQIRSELQRLTYESFLKLDPNPWGEQHADPIAWAKLVAPFGAPTRADEPGFSGTETPTFQMLDAIFSRQVYDSELGQESRHNRDWLPKGFQAFHAAISGIGLREWVIDQSDRELEGLYQAALDAYAGERGFLGIHRLKLYGYIELGFKTGRAATNGGFRADMGPRAWDMVDDFIEAARRERYAGVALPPSQARRVGLEPVTESAEIGVRALRLDVHNQGLRYRPGDRCALLPLNRPELVAKTAASLRANEQTRLQLTKIWRQHLDHHGVATTAKEDHADVDLMTFLRYARLRPVERDSVALLQRLTGSASLHRILESRSEDQWEAWTLFNLVAEDTNYDLRRLWRAAPWEDESLARLLAPDRYRLYSISTAPHGEEVASVPELGLTIGALNYRAKTEPLIPDHDLKGTASSFLLRPLNETEETIPVRIHRPSRFALPKDASRPVVMFAAGTGIAPFTGFLAAREAAGATGPNLLVFGTKNRAQLYCESELAVWAERGHLDIHVAFSREEVVWRPGQSGTAFESGPARRAPQMMTEDSELSARLADYLLDEAEGGRGGFAYICGQSAFAQGVLQALKACFSQHFQAQGVAKEEADNRAEEAYFRQSGRGRLMLDVFTTFKPAMSAGVLGDQAYDASEIAKHNNPTQGYWMVIRGQVYDLTEFKELHPGGAKILVSSAGLDGTKAYEKVEHHLNSEVHAMLDMYKIGHVRRLKFGTAWDYALMPDGMSVFSVAEAYKTWVRMLYYLVETENALVNDFSVQHLALTDREQPDEVTPLKSTLFYETLTRLAGPVIEDLCGKKLLDLWCMTAGIWAPQVPLRTHPAAMEALVQGPVYAATQASLGAWGDHLERRSMSDDPRAGDQAYGVLQTRLQEHAFDFFGTLKARCIEGVQVFEAHEARAFDHGHAELMAVFPGLLDAIETFLSAVTDSLKRHRPEAPEQGDLPC